MGVTADEFTIELGEVFHGPMDLLLHLVREQEVEIHEVRLATVVDGYFQYLRGMRDLNIEVAGEYMVIAATLMAIKSRSLLPREEVELEDDLDPEDELIQRLLEYRRFKGAADDLEDRLQRRNQEYYRGVTNEASQYKVEKSLDMGELTSFDLLAVFSRLMRETLAGQSHTIKGDPRPLRWYVSCLGNAIVQHKNMTLRDLLTSFDEEITKEGLIGSFCALLELIKLGIVSADQDSCRDEIRVSLCENSVGDLDDLMRASRFMDEEEEEPDEANQGESEALLHGEPDSGAEESDEPDSPETATQP
ncbi:MAG: segregation/condensation protein A [Planctomycetes bacterium]|nr:segregation/condensation protein A [Planctomycetota bacterium]